MKLRRSMVAVAIVAALPGPLPQLKSDVSTAGAPHALQRDADRPDVMILLTDQQRADAFGAAGAADLLTPVMDRLARQGVLFTRAFAATPQCSPSRAALLTGLYPHRTGVMGNTGGERGRQGGPCLRRKTGRIVGDRRVGRHRGRRPRGMSAALDRSLPTLGQIFAAAGYETAYFGKWHLGGTPGDTGSSRTTRRSTTRRLPAACRVRAEARRQRSAQAAVSDRLLDEPSRHLQRLHGCPPDARALAAIRLPQTWPTISHEAFPAATLSRGGSGQALCRR